MPADYSSQNLRGRSFKGQNLTGANFSGADIRGADFTEANLRGANFSYARAGLQKRWATFLVLASWALSGLSGLFSGMLIIFLSDVFSRKFSFSGFISGTPSLIILLIFFVITIRQGILKGLLTTISISSIFLILNIVLFFIYGIFSAIFYSETKIIGGDFSRNIRIDSLDEFVTGLIGIVLFGSSGIGTTAIILGLVFTLSITGVVTFAIAEIGGFVGVIVCAGIVGGNFICNLANTYKILFKIVFVIPTLPLSVIGATIIILLSTYIGFHSFKDEKQTSLHSFIIACICIGGTNFHGANLTDANFMQAILKSTNFRDANLTRTFFYKTKKLDLARPGQSYLKNGQVRLLLVSGLGQNKNFDRQDMRGVNLQGANLENASFIDADLYQANLQNANLSRTILVRTNFDRADLRGACLTGSCIQDWTISKGTRLDRIICERIYLKWIDGDKRDQMPPRGKFKEGGFVIFIKHILDTVELYHEKDINPKLALTVLQKMSRDYDEPLDIVALGKRGERVFIQVKVSDSIIRENLKDDYYSRYNTGLKLWSGNAHNLPSNVNSFIENRINEIVSQKTDDFVFIDVTHIEGNYTPTYQGDVTMTGDRNIHMGSGNYNERIQGDYVQGNYYAAGQPQSLAQTAAEIQALLKQLEQTYPTATTQQQMIVAAEAINRIESSPTMKQKVINAVKEGSLAALEKAIDNPLGAFFVGGIKGWQEIKAKD